MAAMDKYKNVAAGLSSEKTNNGRRRLAFHEVCEQDTRYGFSQRKDKNTLCCKTTTPQMTLKHLQNTKNYKEIKFQTDLQVP